MAGCRALQRRIILIIPKRWEEMGTPCPPSPMELVHLAVTGLLQSPCRPLHYLASTSVREKEIKCKEAASTEPLSTTTSQTGVFAGDGGRAMFVPAPLQSACSLVLCLSFPVPKADCCSTALLLVHIAIVLGGGG